MSFKRFMISMPEDLYQDIKNMAYENNIGVSTLIRMHMTQISTENKTKERENNNDYN